MGGFVGLWWLTMEIWIGKNNEGHGSRSPMLLNLGFLSLLTPHGG